MNPSFLVIDSDAVMLLSSTVDPYGDWFSSFSIADREKRIFSAQVQSGVVIVSGSATEDARLLVIDLKKDNFFSYFSSELRSEVLRRILHGAQSAFQGSVAIPYSWRPFNHNSRISFHATSLATRLGAGGDPSYRIELDRNAYSTGHAYVFNCTSKWVDLGDSLADKDLFDRAVSAYKLAVKDNNISAIASDGATSAISLGGESFYYSENRLGFEEWIDSRLTARQKDFVFAPAGTPVRLRGAAGTGKTLALAVRLLVTIKNAVNTGKGMRIVFMTHSASTCDAIDSLLSSLDTNCLKKQFLELPGSELKICTLLDLALEEVGSDLSSSGVLPIATDAIEGRKLQLELIESEVSRFLNSKDWAALKGLCSNEFKSYMDDSASSNGLRRFSWELMNEFSCVLDADGVRQRAELRSKYTKDSRQSWMLPLPAEVDRKVVLIIYDAFSKLVSEMNAITVDQLTADYLNYLDSFRWNAVRERKGFDAIFVDELHLFNRQERMVFSGLTRNQEASTNLYFAYDAKQSPGDTFMIGSSRETERNVWSQIGTKGFQKVELDKVFRYTPQITDFITKLDESYPALDLGEDWGKYSVESVKDSSSIPTICQLIDEKDVYRQVFKRARDLKRRGGLNYSVAVLCCNNDHFITYRDAGDLKNYFRPVSSRDAAAVARPDAYRFLLSAPEYVAGLQFDAVFLLDVNNAETPDGAYSAGLRRRFLSKVYLGASRARSHLELFATASSGGRASILDGAIRSNVLQVSSWEGLPSVSEII